MLASHSTVSVVKLKMVSPFSQILTQAEVMHLTLGRLECWLCHTTAHVNYSPAEQRQPLLEL